MRLARVASVSARWTNCSLKRGAGPALVYRLSAHAEEDVLDVFVQGARRFGVAQAERYHAGLIGVFEMPARFPMAARSRAEITDPVRVYPHGAHIIVYEAAAGDVLILRI